MNPTLKLTEELAADIRARVKSLDFTTIEKLAKAKDQNGTFDVIISTEDVDRSGEIVRQDGWDMTNYKNNPIVLWGHDYYSLPIGVCTETYQTEVHGVRATGAKGVFFSADINPLAQQVRKMYDLGIKTGFNVGCTTSVGFIPKDFEPDNRSVITKAELLEFSFVPVPANQGVGPAQGRSLTFAEAKELGFDIEAMRTKGLEFVEKIEGEEPETKAAQAGDDCTMDDGTLGELASDPNDPDGPMVCIPKDDSEAKATERDSQKKLLKGLGDEHARHSDEIEKALDEFREKSAVIEDQGDPVDAAKAKDGRAAVMREALKDLRSAVQDEHTMHRAKAMACFRGFDPAEDKAFNKKEHLKALRDEHDGYETKNTKAFDEFEERCMKTVQGDQHDNDEDDHDQHTDWIAGKMEESARGHKKAVVKAAKAMCKAAFGEEDQADEKTLAILKEFLTPHVDPLMLTALATKIGAKVSAESKNRIVEAHQHLNAAKAVLEALHPDFADGDGEEGRSDEEKSSPAPVQPRSKPRTSSRSDEALKAHLQAREIVGGIEAAAREALGKIKADIRTHSRK